jgi:hypothetical protein
VRIVLICRPQFLVKTYDITEHSNIQHQLTKREQEIANIVDRANILKVTPTNVTNK